MNEPKRRGRPPKALAEALAKTKEAVTSGPFGVKPCPECGQVGSHYDDCGAGITALDSHVAEHHADMISSAEFACGLTPDHERNRAQAYALRVWAGQHIFEPRSWRIQRVKEALAGQGLPFEGVELP